MTVGQRIRKLREEAGQSQTDLAEKMHVSKQTLYKYEMDIVTNIPSDKIELAAKALDSTPAYLMGWTVSQTDQTCGISTACHDSDAYRIVQSFLRLDYEDRQTVAGMIDVLLEKDKYREKEAI